MAHKLPDDFEPAPRIFELCDNFGIDKEWAKLQVMEFKFHWQQKGTMRIDWQRSFWNWIKKGWSWKCKEERKTKTRCAVGFLEMPKIEKSKSRPGGKRLADMIRER